MAKKKEDESLSDSQENITTTTTTEAPKKVDLQNYLDSLSLTRAERTYYERTYGQNQNLKTYEEWKIEIKIVH
jgi:hypothetical protein